MITAHQSNRHQFRVPVRLKHVVLYKVPLSIIAAEMPTLSGRSDIALGLGLILIIKLLAKVQQRIHHIVGFQLWLKIKPNVSS